VRRKRKRFDIKGKTIVIWIYALKICTSTNGLSFLGVKAALSHSLEMLITVDKGPRGRREEEEGGAGADCRG
jgi:hypothetical protein